MSEELIPSNIAADIRRKKVTDEEKTLLARVSRANTLEEVFPDDIKPSDFALGVRAVCTGLGRAEAAKNTLMPALGRLMYLAQQFPELWNTKYETYESYVDSLYVTFGASRSTCYEARKNYERWGKVLTVAQFEAVGRTGVKLLNKAVPRGDEAKATPRKLVDMLVKDTVAKVKEYCQDKGLITADEATGGFFRFPCNKKQLKIFKKFFGDGRIHAYVESGHVAEILEAMIAECEQTWIEKGEEAMEAAKGKSEVVEVTAEAS